MKENTLKRYKTKYEEINDYSFLNSLTEEIINLTDKCDLENILVSNRFYKICINTNLQLSSNKDYEVIVRRMNNLEYKILLHNINNISYLEIIDNHNKDYTLQLSDNKICKVKNTILDNILTYLIEDSNKIE